MTNEEILKAALEQSAEDCGCHASDFQKDTNIIVRYAPRKGIRKYYSEPMVCTLISYGSNIVAAVNDDNRDVVSDYINRFTYYHCFETPNMNLLNEMLAPLGQKVCFMAEYFLPDMKRLAPSECGYEMRIMHQKDFGELYLPQWSNALCEKRKELDVLGIGAYDNCRLIGLAACSADCDTMWQIGIDVLPGYRRQGIASALTSTLACEIIRAGKVPFYCSAWSNIRSVRNAIKSGFSPAWVEMSIKPSDIVDEINR